MLFVFPPPNRKRYWAHFPARWLGWAELGNSVQLVFHAQLWKMYLLRNILTPPMVQEPTLIHVGFRTHASPWFDTFLDHFGLLLLFCGFFLLGKKTLLENDATLKTFLSYQPFKSMAAWLIMYQEPQTHQNPACWNWLPVLDFPSHDHSYSIYCMYFIFFFLSCQIRGVSLGDRSIAWIQKGTLLLKVRT